MTEAWPAGCFSTLNGTYILFVIFWYISHFILEATTSQASPWVRPWDLLYVLYFFKKAIYPIFHLSIKWFPFYLNLLLPTIDNFWWLSFGVNHSMVLSWDSMWSLPFDVEPHFTLLEGEKKSNNLFSLVTDR